MDALFRETGIKLIRDNIIKLIADDWMLITAGSIEKYNTMTANWGGLGYLWNRDVCFVFIRPQRYTFEFLERSSSFTLSFFDNKYRDELFICGSKSGRDIDKAKECGFTPFSPSKDNVSFSESRLIIECKKIFFQDISESGFVDPSINKVYPQKDFHRLYIGEIVRTLTKEQSHEKD